MVEIKPLDTKSSDDQKYKRACRSLRCKQSLVGFKYQTSLKSNCIGAVILIFVPVILLFITFSVPVCSVFDDESCHNSYKRYLFWIPAALSMLPYALITLYQFELLVTYPLCSKRWNLVHYIGITFLLFPVAVIISEICRLIWLPFPFFFPVNVAILLPVALIQIFYFLYQHIYKDLPESSPARSDLIWGTFWHILILCNTVAMMLTYLAYIYVYRRLQHGYWLWNALWSVVALFAMREGFLEAYKFILHRSNLDKMFNIPCEMYCFALHSLVLGILRGESEGVGQLITLSVCDIMSCGGALAMIWYHAKTHDEDDEEGNEKLLYFTGYIILEEMVEVMVPPIYFVCVSCIYYSDLSEYFAGIGTAAFGLPEMNITNLQQSIGIVWACELLSFTIVNFSLQRGMNINLMHFCDGLVSQYKIEFLFCILANIMYFFSISYIPFGADTSFKFKWLEV